MYERTLYTVAFCCQCMTCIYGHHAFELIFIQTVVLCITTFVPECGEFDLLPRDATASYTMYQQPLKRINGLLYSQSHFQATHALCCFGMRCGNGATSLACGYSLQTVKCFNWTNMALIFQCYRVNCFQWRVCGIYILADRTIFCIESGPVQVECCVLVWSEVTTCVGWLLSIDIIIPVLWSN